MTDLILEDVSKRFGGVIAAQDVRMRFPGGQVTGIIGPNGAGKTTLVNLITGMLPLSGGRILLDRHDLTHANATAIGRSGIARTFQNIRLLPDETVAANVMIGLQRLERSSVLAGMLGLPSTLRETAATRQRAGALLERFGLARFADHSAGSLSYGHQRRVEMMRALAADPAVLLLDEPVAGMSDVEARELGEIFADLAADGVAVMVIEHNVRFMAEICKFIYVLDHGQVIAEGPPGVVMRDPRVIAAYLGAEPC